VLYLVALSCYNNLNKLYLSKTYNPSGSMPIFCLCCLSQLCLIKIDNQITTSIMKNLSFALVSVLSLVTGNTVVAQDIVQNNKVEYIKLLGDNTFPEGIHTAPDGGFFVGGFGDGSIQKIDKNNSVSYYSKPGENGMTMAVGMAIDEKRNELWVANFNFKTESGKPGSNLKIINLATGKLIKTLPENYIEGVFFNEIAIDDKGIVYVSDTFNPQIWTANANKSAPEVFVKNDLLSNPAPDQPFDLNGLAISPDNKHLIASVMDRLDAGDGRLVSINIATKAVAAVSLKGDVAVKAFAGSDGMFFNKGQLYMVNVFSKAGAIITAKFNNDYSTATLTIRDKFQSVYNRPTASAISNGRLYTVNSQMNHIIDDADGKLNTPWEKPFKVVSVPLSDLLK
jgi:sugar lactone lactonase YvrE